MKTLKTLRTIAILTLTAANIVLCLCGLWMLGVTLQSVATCLMLTAAA